MMRSLYTQTGLPLLVADEMKTLKWALRTARSIQINQPFVMKNLRITFVLLLILTCPAASRSASIFFSVDFNGDPPPHTPGVPDSGALLMDDWFYTSVFLDGTPPVSGRILEKWGDDFTPVFQFTNLVFAGYPPPAIGAAYDYEGVWQLSESQIENVLAGRWYAEINYADTTYLGQYTVVPEPSSLTLLLSGITGAILLHRPITLFLGLKRRAR